MLRHDAVALAAITALKDALKGMEADARAVVLDDLLALRSASGVKSADVLLPDDTKVGTLSLVQPKALGARVIDDAAFLAHVSQVAPGHIIHHPEVVTPAYDSVDPAFIEEYLPSLHDDGTGYAVDEDGCCVPGVLIDAKAPTPKSFRLASSKEEKRALVQAWRDGKLKAIIAGEAPALADGRA